MKARVRHPLITPERLRKRAIVYLRQSTMTQVRNNWGSTEVQREQVETAREYGWPDAMIDIIDEDLGRSGASTGHRTGWQQMLRRLPSSTIGAVFTYTVSRLARELRDFEELRVLTKLYGVVLVIDRRPTDPDDPHDTFTLQVHAAVAQLDNHSRAQGMSRARREKARQGAVVSRLPVGWITLPDGTYAFDPAVRSSIAHVYEVFWRVRSVLATVRALTAEGVSVPVRRRKQIVWNPPRAGTIREFLVNQAYAGFYVYGKTENRPELGLGPTGYPRRRLAPRERWIVLENHHPAYITDAQQGEIRAILASKRFTRRERPGRGPALGQGLLYCGTCGVRLSVLYPRRASHRYECQKNPTTFGRVGCFHVRGQDIDDAIVRLVLSRLTTPPIEELKRALAETRADARNAIERLEAEQRRLSNDVDLARARYDQCDPHNRMVALDNEERLEHALKMLAAFNERQASAPSLPPVEGSVEELERLGALVRTVPTLWGHPEVTDLERKEILACVVERVSLIVDREQIKATLRWRGGDESELLILRRTGVHRLVLALHHDGLTVPQIDERLRQPHPDTGQTWHYNRSAIHWIIRRAGEKPHSSRVMSPTAMAELRRLQSSGLTHRQIADAMNELGILTAHRRPWTDGSVRHAFRAARPSRRVGRAA